MIFSSGLHSVSLVLCAMIGLCAVLVSGCGKTQLGPQAYEIAVALDTVLENEDPAQLAQASELIDAQRDAGDLSSAEAQQLMGLVEMGRADNWSGARAKLRRLLSDQTDW